MKKVTVSAFVDGVGAIYAEKPEYQEGHDGSDGKCDCIGMVRGALKRAGASDVANMRGTNQAARKALKGLEQFDTSAALCVGDVVLKTRDKDDKNYPLPDRYRKGGADYDPNVGEINFTHIGTVTSTSPLVITHMTSPTAKQDKTAKGWTYVAELPWVEYEAAPEPQPEPQTAVVFAHTGGTVNMRRFPNIGAALVERVPIGETVDVLQYGDDWTKIRWRRYTGYMQTRFLVFSGENELLYTVTIPGLTKAQADALAAEYPAARIESGW